MLPYKFNGVKDEIYITMNNISQKINKPLWCFYNDDNDTQFNISSNVVLYRTSFYNSTKLKNEFPLIAFSPDYFTNNILSNPKLSIGYCGHIMHGRKEYLSLLLKSEINTNFILRRGFWAPGITKELARKQYFDNMEIFSF